MNIFRASVILGFLLTTIGLCSAQEKEPKYYLADWSSLKKYEVPDWYYDAKFGIWTHWGVYSVPGYRGTHAAEWYPRWMYLVEKADEPFTDYQMQGAAIAKHHIEMYGTPDKFGYQDFIQMWKAENWDPDNWAQLAIDCGAKFFTITGMHHDGFALYDSKYTPWNAAQMGPKRDLVGDLGKAVRAKGLKFGISNHFANNHHFYEYFFQNGFDSQFKDHPELADLFSSRVQDDAQIERWWNITTEMADKYKPDLYYFDWGWNKPFWENERPEFCAFFYNLAIRSGMGTYGKPNVVINYKNSSVADGCAVLDLERASMGKIKKFIWQTDTSISDHSWGYSSDDTFKSPKDLITMLVDIVSKNGVLMLNVGPKADGTIPDECKSSLLEMGEWLKVNGDAIYASRPWEVYGEGPTDAGKHDAGKYYSYNDIRYTRSKDGSKMYVTVFGLPEKKLTLQLTDVVKVADNAKITMLSNQKPISFNLNKKQQLVLDLSKINESNAGCKYAYCFCVEGIEIKGRELSALDQADIYILYPKNTNSEAKTYNSKLPYISGITSVFELAHNGVKRDINYYGNAIKLDGVSYDHGLMVCPNGDSNLGVFILNRKEFPQYNGIKAMVGIEDAVDRGSCEFIVEAFVNDEWIRLFESKVLRPKDKAVDVDVKFPKKTEFIRLITTYGGDNCSADHAIWADLKFTK